MSTQRISGMLIVIGLFVLSLLPLHDLLQSGLPVTHDGKDHVARIANFYQSLAEGNVVPRWSENLNWGYGHPVTMFLYPLPSYIASGFHFFGFSLIDSTKLVFAVSFVASVLAMYLWAQAVWGKHAGMTAAVLYGFAPYRFVDMYVRGALGEHVAFIFLPLILWSLWRLSNPANDVRASLAALTVSIGALVLAHNALSMMFLGVVTAYGFYLFLYSAKNRKQFLLLAIVGLAWGMAIAAFFWIPAFFEGKYTLRDIVTAGDFAKRFVPPFWFLWSGWNFGGGNEFSKFLGIAQWSAILIAIWTYKTLSKWDKRILMFVFLFLLISLFLMTEYSVSIWQNITLIQKFQFPWRLLSVSVFFTSCIGALAVMGSRKRQSIIVAVLVLLAILSTIPMWHADGYTEYPERYFIDRYHGTTDTGESSPIWSIRFMEQLPVAPIEIVRGLGNIEVSDRISTRHVYKVSAETELSLVENTLYFPGWNVFVDGKVVPVEFQNPNYRGLMTFTVEPGSHIVEVRFTQTRLRKYADAVSAAAGVSFILFLGTMAVWRPKKLHSRLR